MITGQKIILPCLIAGFFLQGCAPSPGSSGEAAVSESSDQMCAASLAKSSFFEDVDMAANKPPEAEKGALRYRNVHVDVQALKEILKSGQGAIRFDLFDDKTVIAMVEKVEVSQEGNFVMQGRVANDPLSQVTLAIEDNVVIANIHPGAGPRYVLQYQSEDVHTIQEVDALAFDGGEHCEAIEAPPGEEEDQAMIEDDGQSHTTPVIDMLVAYTPAARSRAGGTSAMKATIEMGVADTNRAFSNSGVKLLVRLVGTMEVPQNDTNNFSGDLSRLRSKTDGRWDSVHAKRKALGADQVTLIGVYSGNGTAGIGYIGATSSSAFSVVKLSAFGAYTFSHELGHNIGLNHSDGYQNSSGRFRTIMAYGSYPRIARFSNPNISYKGYRTGDSNQNSASILNARGRKVALLSANMVSSSKIQIPLIPAKDETVGSCQ